MALNCCTERLETNETSYGRMIQIASMQAKAIDQLVPALVAECSSLFVSFSSQCQHLIGKEKTNTTLDLIVIDRLDFCVKSTSQLSL